MSRFIDLSTVWCIEPNAARSYLRIYGEILARKAQGIPFDKAKVEAATGQELGQSRGYELRGSVAVMPIRGAIVQHGDLLSEVSGTPSIEGLQRTLSAALNDKAVKSIVLAFDSPGGSVNGTADFARFIRNATGRKPIVAYAEGAMASAAYWLAAAADEVVVSQSAHPVGSIGALMGWTDDRALKENLGLEDIEFISSQSPLKNPDPKSDAGKAEYQKMVDAAADVFINEVAAFRGISAKDVQENYGRGGCFVGAAAVGPNRSKLADRVESLDGLVARLNSGNFATGDTNMSAKDTIKGWFNPTVSEEERDENAGELAAQIEALQGDKRELTAKVAALEAEKAAAETYIAKLQQAQDAAEEAAKAEAAAKLDADAEAFVTSLKAKIEPAKLEAHDFKADYLAAHQNGTLETLTAAFDAIPENPLLAGIKEGEAPKLSAVPKPEPEKGSTLAAAQKVLDNEYKKPAAAA